jgi:hypothetical protein
LIALGSDTGGSVRIPAALTGNVGQRTSLGRWPTTGVVPLSSTLDTVGALTRTVEDAAWFFGSVDPKWGDPRALLRELEGATTRGLRIAIPRCDIWEECQADIKDALDVALAELDAHGADLIEIDGELLDDGFEGRSRSGRSPPPSCARSSRGSCPTGSTWSPPSSGSACRMPRARTTPSTSTRWPVTGAWSRRPSGCSSRPTCSPFRRTTSRRRRWRSWPTSGATRR